MRRVWRSVLALVAVGLTSCAQDGTVGGRDPDVELRWRTERSVSLDGRPAMTAAAGDLLVVNSARWSDSHAPDFGLRRPDGSWANPPDLPVEFNAVALATVDGEAIAAVAACSTDDCSVSEQEQLRLEFWALEGRAEWRRVATGPSFREEVEIGALPGDHRRALFFAGGQQYLVTAEGDVSVRSNEPATPNGSAVVCLLADGVLTIDLARTAPIGIDGSVRWRPIAVRTAGFDAFDQPGEPGAVPSGAVPGIEHARCGPSGLVSLADGRETTYDPSTDTWTERQVATGAAALSEAISRSDSGIVGIDAVSGTVMRRHPGGTWTTETERAVQLVEVGDQVLVQTTDGRLEDLPS